VTDGDTDDARILARTPRTPRWTFPWVLLQGAMLAYWTWQIGAEEQGTARAVIVAVGAILLVAFVAAMVQLYRGRGGAAVVLSERELRLERRVRPVTLARHEVLAVRGNVPGRPSWSERVVIETPGGLVSLPLLDKSPALIVPRLQEWAGVSEQIKPSDNEHVNGGID